LGWEETGVEIADLEFLSSHPNLYPYKGILYPVMDFFFTAQVDSLDGAHARDEVLEIVRLPVGKLDPAELAFDSMRRAGADFLAQYKV
jgi:hypothetical protein